MISVSLVLFVFPFSELGFLFVDLVLELIEGGDLLDFIMSRNGLSEPMAQHITSQICSALSVCNPNSRSYGDSRLDSDDAVTTYTVHT
jgi:serine/threonine protein kinase